VRVGGIALSTTFGAILDSLIDEAPGLGWKFTGTATSSGAVATTTDPELNKGGSSAPAERFRGAFLYIPSASGADQTHSVLTIAVNATSGVTTITTVGAYSSTHSSQVMYLLARHPSQIMALVNDARDDIKVECEIVLAHGPTDADMQATAATAWTASNATIAKQTTATEVLSGQRSLSITATSAPGTATSDVVPAGKRETVTAYAILRADTGTGQLVIEDDSGNDIDSVAITQSHWLFAKKQVQLEDDDNGVASRLVADANNDQLDVQAAWVVKASENIFDLSSWIDSRFKIKAVSRVHYTQPGVDQDTWLARSYRVERLVEGSHYRFISRRSDANPHALEFFDNSYSQHPVVITVDCPDTAPYGINASFTAYTDTTDADPRKVIARSKMLLAQRYPSKWGELEGLAAKEWFDRTISSSTAPPKFAPWRGPTGGRFI